MLHAVPRYLLHHTHTPNECAVSYVAWKGFQSPLRRTSTIASCLEGGHSVWWDVEADNPTGALALLPPYVARRTLALAVREVAIP